jgi:hypothetical protein
MKIRDTSRCKSVAGVVLAPEYAREDSVLILGASDKVPVERHEGSKKEELDK